MKLALISITFLAALCFGHVVKRQVSNDVFKDVVRQKTRGNQIQQCPCVIHPESRQCISYDSRYIAVNYEEAILSFLDLSKHRSQPAPLINSNTFACSNQECQQCFSLLYHKLGDLGFIPANYRSSIPPLPQNQLNPRLCPRYNFAAPVLTPVAPAVIPTYLQSLIAAGKQFRSTISPSAHARSGEGNPPSASPHSPPNNRNNNGNSPNSRNQNNNRNQNQNQNGNGNGNSNFNSNPNSRNSQNQQQGRPNFNQNNRNNNNQLQNQRTQFRNNQAMRNRFNAQQRANNAFQNNLQRPFQQNQFQRPWQNQQQFRQPQFQNSNPRPFQNFNGNVGVQQHWNGRFWEPVGHAVSEAIRNPIQNAVGNAWSNGGQQGNGGGFPQAPVVQPAPAPAPIAPQPLPPTWSGGAGDGFGGGHLGGIWGSSGGQSQNQNGGFFGGFGGFKNRQKRAPMSTVIGKRFTINCLQRGDSEDDMLALCGSCWTWRQLPDNYFPRIINELSCKQDDYCLSGWGECVQQYRNVDVLRRDNGRWVPTVITTSTCCDCRVRAGTEIHSLVIGDKH